MAHTCRHKGRGHVSRQSLGEVVGAVKEGLCVWAADYYRVLTAEEYAFDVGD